MSLWDTIKDTAGDAWDGVKETASDFADDPLGTLWENKGKIAMMGAGPLGWAAGGIFDRDYDEIAKGKKYEDLPWYDRIGISLKAKGEGLLESGAGLFGLEDEVGTTNRDILAGLKHKVSDDYGTSFSMGGNISGASGGGLPQGGGGGMPGATPNAGTSLGRAIAIEQDPALEEQTFNNNNFSF